MFHFISGRLDTVRQGFAVIDAGGVGFRLTVSDNTYQALSQKQGSNVRLFTHLSVREDDMELFGFLSEAELDMFKLLITVSGVGPKAAMAILSIFTPESFALAVCTDNKRSIAKANGIGPKTAARIILELHDKMADANAFPALDDTASEATGAELSGGGKMAEVREALLVLGYSRSEILNALHDLDVENSGVEDIIRMALKKLMR